MCEMLSYFIKRYADEIFKMDIPKPDGGKLTIYEKIPLVLKQFLPVATIADNSINYDEVIKVINQKIEKKQADDSINYKEVTNQNQKTEKEQKELFEYYKTFPFDSIVFINITMWNPNKLDNNFNPIRLPLISNLNSSFANNNPLFGKYNEIWGKYIENTNKLLSRTPPFYTINAFINSEYVSQKINFAIHFSATSSQYLTFLSGFSFAITVYNKELRDKFKSYADNYANLEELLNNNDNNYLNEFSDKQKTILKNLVDDIKKNWRVKDLNVHNLTREVIVFLSQLLLWKDLGENAPDHFYFFVLSIPKISEKQPGTTPIMVVATKYPLTEQAKCFLNGIKDYLLMQALGEIIADQVPTIGRNQMCRIMKSFLKKNDNNNEIGPLFYIGHDIEPKYRNGLLEEISGEKGIEVNKITLKTVIEHIKEKTTKKINEFNEIEKERYELEKIMEFFDSINDPNKKNHLTQDDYNLTGEKIWEKLTNLEGIKKEKFKVDLGTILDSFQNTYTEKLKRFPTNIPQCELLFSDAEIVTTTLIQLANRAQQITVYTKDNDGYFYLLFQINENNNVNEVILDSKNYGDTFNAVKICNKFSDVVIITGSSYYYANNLSNKMEFKSNGEINNFIPTEVVRILGWNYNINAYPLTIIVRIFDEEKIRNLNLTYNREEEKK